MNKQKAPPLSEQILEDATTWFVEFNEGGVGRAAREEFIEWLRISPEHVRAYLQVTAHWEDARALREAAVPSIEELVLMAQEPSNANVIPIGAIRPSEVVKEPASIEGLGGETREVFTRSHGLRRLLMAAGVTAFMVGSGALYWLEYQRGVYSTDIGEQRSIQLEDGSTVELNARSKIRVALHARERDVELIEGQALFRVAKDHARPFIVHSGETDVLAVGTQFDVNRRRSGTTVTVVEGRVAVLGTPRRGSAAMVGLPDSGKPSASNEEIFLGAGEQVRVSGAAMQKATSADVAAATAWIQKQIVFNNTPLSEVVDEFNRYNTRQLVITDPSIADTKISGEFSSTNPDSLLKGLDGLKKFTIRGTSSRIEISGQ